MTISAAIPRSGPFSGDGGTVAFAFGFLIDDEAEIRVVVADASGIETAQVLNTDYTVTGVGNNAGGTVTFVTAPAATETVSMRRITVQDQGIDLQNRGSVVPQVVEDGLDELTKMIQDLQEQMGRAVLLKLTANTVDIEIPAPSDGDVLGWSGTQLVNVSPNSDTYLTFPAGATDGQVPRFDGTTGKVIQISQVVIDDNNYMTGVERLAIGNGADSNRALTVKQGAVSLPSISGNTAAVFANTTNAFLTILGGNTGLVDLRFGDTDDEDVAYFRYNHSLDLLIAEAAGGQWRLDANGFTLGTTTPDRALRIDGTDAMNLPKGPTAQRPGAPETGDLRFSSTLDAAELYTTGGGWITLAAAAGSFKGNDGSKNTANTGDIFRVHDQLLDTDVTIASTENALAAGPLEIDTGVTLRVEGNLSLI